MELLWVAKPFCLKHSSQISLKISCYVLEVFFIPTAFNHAVAYATWLIFVASS